MVHNLIWEVRTIHMGDTLTTSDNSSENHVNKGALDAYHHPVSGFVNISESLLLLRSSGTLLNL